MNHAAAALDVDATTIAAIAQRLKSLIVESCIDLSS